MSPPFDVRSGAAPGVQLDTVDASGNVTVNGSLTVVGALISSEAADALGHPTHTVNPLQLAAGAVGTTAAGTISPTTNAGAAPTVTSVSADDARGSFILNPVTGGGAQAAGVVAEVRWSRFYTVVPNSVHLQCIDITTPSNPAGQNPIYASTVNAAGFSITTPVLTTAHTYLITFQVVP